MLHVTCADRERLVQQDIVRRLVARQIDHDLIRPDDSSPCRIHGVCFSVLIIGADNHNRLRK